MPIAAHMRWLCGIRFMFGVHVALRIVRVPIGAARGSRFAAPRARSRLENAHDLAAVLQTFGPSARYDDEPWDEHHEGRDAVRSFYEGLLRALPDLEIVVGHEHATADAVVVECVIRGTPAARGAICRRRAAIE